MSLSERERLEAAKAARLAASAKKLFFATIVFVFVSAAFHALGSVSFSVASGITACLLGSAALGCLFVLDQ